MRDHPGLRHLAPNERDALDELLAWLQPRCGDRVVHAWLFGSKARGDYRLVLNRAYYAVFRLTAAVLSSMGIVRHRHSGVESALHEYLIKPGLLEPGYGRFYRQARQWRENADYHLCVEFPAETAREVFDQAGRIVARLEQLLRERSLDEE